MVCLALGPLKPAGLRSSLTTAEWAAANSRMVDAQVRGKKVPSFAVWPGLASASGSAAHWQPAQMQRSAKASLAGDRVCHTSVVPASDILQPIMGGCCLWLLNSGHQERTARRVCRGAETKGDSMIDCHALVFFSDRHF